MFDGHIACYIYLSFGSKTISICVLTREQVKIIRLPEISRIQSNNTRLTHHLTLSRFVHIIQSNNFEITLI